jgi:hypothetical protein
MVPSGNYVFLGYQKIKCGFWAKQPFNNDKHGGIHTILKNTEHIVTCVKFPWFSNVSTATTMH